MSKLVKLLVGAAILACGCVFSVFGQDAGANLLKQWNLFGTEGNTVIQDDGVIACENKDAKESSGVVQSVVLDQTEAKTIEISGESKAENASGDLDCDNYSIYLDIVHPDGTKTYGVTVAFKTSTHDWEKVSLSYTPTKPIKSLACRMLFRNKTGKVWFKNGVLIQRLAGGETPAMIRTLDKNGFHTQNGEKFWSRPLYGPNRRMFVPAGELPHASFMWFDAKDRIFVKCGNLLPGIISANGTKWLYQAESITATYDPGLLRFVCKDSSWDGELQMTLVPLVENNGYIVKISSTAQTEFAFAFGGFQSMDRKAVDKYQGNYEMPGGIVADIFSNAKYSAQEDGIVLNTLENLTGTKNEPLNMTLSVAMLCDRKTAVSLHEAQTGGRWRICSKKTQE